MYEQHFGLAQKPFRLTPDASFFFPSAQHRRGLAFLEYGLHEGEGFVVITGEPGTGKSTLVSKLVAEHARESVSVVTVETTRLSDENLLQLLVSRFGFPPPSSRATKAAYLETLREGLVAGQRAGRRALLIVDEAQNLPRDTIEELRMLSNFVCERRPLLQTFLIGQPALRARIASADFEQLRQRVTASLHLLPLEGPEDVRAYVEHRLHRAGWSGDPAFAAEAFAGIHAATGGTPRLVNILCDRLLLYAFLEDAHGIDADAVELVGREAGLCGTPVAVERQPVQTPSPGPCRPESAGLEATAGGLDVVSEAIDRLRAVESRLEQLERRVHLELRLVRRAVSNRDGGL